MELRPFQKRFVKGALAPGVDVGALSIPRGNGKSWLGCPSAGAGPYPRRSPTRTGRGVHPVRGQP